MSKSMLFAAVFLTYLIFPASLKAQESGEKIPLAVLPFVLSQGASIGNPADVVTIQEIVTTEFTNKTRFTVLDRSKFQKIIDELKIQTMDQFLDSKVVAQGKQLGAKYLVAGVVNEYKTTRSEKTNILHPGQKFMTYPCSLKMSFGVIDLESGKLLFNSPINVASNDIYSGDSLASSKKALSNMQDEVNKQIKNILAGTLQILGVGKADKDGQPATVMTNGGNTIFTTGDKKTKLGIFISQNFGGYTRETQVAELKSPHVEGEIVEWDVNKKEAKALSDAITAKTTMTLRIISK